VPGALSNQPPATPSAPINGASAPLQVAQPNSGTSAAPGAAGTRRENVVNYEVDKTVRVTRNATGMVKRLTAAVVLNHRNVVDAKGKSVPTVLTQEELDKLTALVQESIGFNKERGDSVRVVSAPFHVDATDRTDELPLWQQPWLQGLLRSAGMPVALTLVALMLLLGLVRPALRPPALPLEPALPPPGSQLNAVVDDPQLLPEPTTDTPTGGRAGPMLLADENNTATLEQMRALAKSNPAVVANILRSWFNKQG
jgi:flagellar M-ring protein FliF